MSRQLNTWPLQLPDITEYLRAASVESRRSTDGPKGKVKLCPLAMLDTAANDVIQRAKDVNSCLSWHDEPSESYNVMGVPLPAVVWAERTILLPVV